MLLPIALFFLSLGNTFNFSAEVKSKFLYATAFFSGLSILLQTGTGLVELYQSGPNFLKLLFSKFVSGIFGPYGTDLLLSICKYSTRLDLEKKEFRGRFWRFLVFGDPYSGAFQTRYKSTAIWLRQDPGPGEGHYEGRGEGRGELIEEAKKRLENKSIFHHTVKIRNTTMSLRWYKNGLHTRKLTDCIRVGDDSVVEVLLYSSQASNYGGLFHHQFGPLSTKWDSVVQLVAMMEILAKDSFVVQKSAGQVEGHMLCISFEETMERVLRNGEKLDFDLHTGASYG